METLSIRPYSSSVGGLTPEKSETQIEFYFGEEYETSVKNDILSALADIEDEFILFHRLHPDSPGFVGTSQPTSHEDVWQYTSTEGITLEMLSRNGIFKIEENQGLYEVIYLNGKRLALPKGIKFAFPIHIIGISPDSSNRFVTRNRDSTSAEIDEDELVRFLTENVGGFLSDDELRRIIHLCEMGLDSLGPNIPFESGLRLGELNRHLANSIIDKVMQRDDIVTVSEDEVDDLKKRIDEENYYIPEGETYRPNTLKYLVYPRTGWIGMELSNKTDKDHLEILPKKYHGTVEKYVKTRPKGDKEIELTDSENQPNNKAIEENISVSFVGKAIRLPITTLDVPNRQGDVLRMRNILSVTALSAIHHFGEQVHVIQISRQGWARYKLSPDTENNPPVIAHAVKPKEKQEILMLAETSFLGDGVYIIPRSRLQQDLEDKGFTETCLEDCYTKFLSTLISLSYENYSDEDQQLWGKRLTLQDVLNHKNSSLALSILDHLKIAKEQGVFDERFSLMKTLFEERISQANGAMEDMKNNLIELALEVIESLVKFGEKVENDGLTFLSAPKEIRDLRNNSSIMDQYKDLLNQEPLGSFSAEIKSARKVYRSILIKLNDLLNAPPQSFDKEEIKEVIKEVKCMRSYLSKLLELYSDKKSELAITKRVLSYVSRVITETIDHIPEIAFILVFIIFLSAIINFGLDRAFPSVVGYAEQRGISIVDRGYDDGRPGLRPFGAEDSYFSADPSPDIDVNALSQALAESKNIEDLVGKFFVGWRRPVVQVNSDGTLRMPSNVGGYYAGGSFATPGENRSNELPVLVQSVTDFRFSPVSQAEGELSIFSTEIMPGETLVPARNEDWIRSIVPSGNSSESDFLNSDITVSKYSAGYYIITSYSKRKLSADIYFETGAPARDFSPPRPEHIQINGDIENFSDDHLQFINIVNNLDQKLNSERGYGLSNEEKSDLVLYYTFLYKMWDQGKLAQELNIYGSIGREINNQDLTNIINARLGDCDSFQATVVNLQRALDVPTRYSFSWVVPVDGILRASNGHGTQEIYMGDNIGWAPKDIYPRDMAKTLDWVRQIDPEHDIGVESFLTSVMVGRLETSVREQISADQALEISVMQNLLDQAYENYELNGGALPGIDLRGFPEITEDDNSVFYFTPQGSEYRKAQRTYFETLQKIDSLEPGFLDYFKRAYGYEIIAILMTTGGLGKLIKLASENRKLRKRIERGNGKMGKEITREKAHDQAQKSRKRNRQEEGGRKKSGN